ncbi:hypothetical protein ACT3SP_12235 [Brachybacterium sp. AOP43-C2-M15]|uniref:hypothetical protein n=1 Tax=Brachybacterium sp. AOP43-C2-M15 TaxID=3457661 RepID=UPI004033AC26
MEQDRGRSGDPGSEPAEERTRELEERVRRLEERQRRIGPRLDQVESAVRLAICLSVVLVLAVGSLLPWLGDGPEDERRTYRLGLVPVQILLGAARSADPAEPAGTAGPSGPDLLLVVAMTVFAVTTLGAVLALVAVARQATVHPVMGSVLVAVLICCGAGALLLTGLAAGRVAERPSLGEVHWAPILLWCTGATLTGAVLRAARSPFGSILGRF